MTQHISDEIILERLLPYMLFLVNDSLPQVRAQALKILSHCLQLVRSVPRSDANIFPEYVLPSLSWLTQDQEVIVRIAYAKNIASLAETALKFLEMAQLDYANQENNEDDDSPIQYQVLLFFERDWLWVNLSILNYIERAIINNYCLLIAGLLELCFFFPAHYVLCFWRIMHQKSPIMCELCNIFKQKFLMFQFIKVANLL